MLTNLFGICQIQIVHDVDELINRLCESRIELLLFRNASLQDASSCE